MKQINYISFLLVLILSGALNAQVTISRQVIGSTGSYATGTTMTISSTVGEASVQTLFSVNRIITQGFQQPEGSNDSIVEFEIINESCPGAKNGSIFVSDVLGCPGPYNLVIKSVDDSTTVLGQDTLSTGFYDVVIIGSNSCVYPIRMFVGLDSDEDCTLKFYTGITPNGDGKNDKWIIENIEQFPDNDIKIFNRWGEIVWDAEGYDNSTVVWDGENGGGGQLESATYFYVANVSGQVYRGWVELTR
jgi:gliding motility-associated-like protein